MNIVVIDDSASMLKLVQRFLELEGYLNASFHRTIASSRKDLGHLGQAPQLVIVDNNMPGQKGIDFIRQLNSAPGSKAIRPIKPFSRAELGDLLRRHQIFPE